MNSSDTPTLVISLDFELFWGRFDTATLDGYRTNLLGVRQAVPRLLQVFESRGIHATWATVGFLFFDNKLDLLNSLPDVRPRYPNPGQSPYEHLGVVGDDEATDPFHFGHSLLESIRKHRGQEIGTHTMAHHCGLEPGQTTETFAADLEAACTSASDRGIALRSIVFPRNQYEQSHLEICRQLGLTSFRGTEDSSLYRPRPRAQQRLPLRFARLLDAYFPVAGYQGFPARGSAGTNPTNIRSSRFLRPYSPRLRALEPLRYHRITQEMTTAAKRGDVFHLWWHPHNFGTHQDENFRFLERILDRFSSLSTRYGMQSLSMGELADRLRN